MEYTTALKTKLLVHENEEEEFSVIGYRENRIKTMLFMIIGVLTAGFGFLFGYWYPVHKLKFTNYICSINEATSVLIKQTDGELSYVSKIKVMALDGKNMKMEEYTNTEKILLKLGTVRFFEHKFVKYVINCNKITEIIGVEWSVAYTRNEIRGLSEHVCKMKTLIYGENYINVPVKPYWFLFLKFCLDPFYVFQLYSVILWMNDDYEYYAALILIITITSLCMNTYETKSHLQKLHDMIAKSIPVSVLHADGLQLQSKSSRDLVPGDILVVPPNNFELPCDVILLSGRCTVNESSLTGESFPVTKTAHDPILQQNNIGKKKQHTIYNGTNVLQACIEADSKHVLALVVRTGFSTLKGGMIRSIIFPKPIYFTFFRDSMRFIFCLALIAGVGFIYSVFIFIKNGAAPGLIIKRALDLFTIVIPPALPAAMSAGVFLALRRLKIHHIHCIDPLRINICGKTKLVVFDKTGTLTEDHLSVSEIVVVKQGSIDGVFKTPNETEEMTRAMASCHSLTLIDEEVMGDPIDKHMHQFTGWTLFDVDGNVKDDVMFSRLTHVQMLSMPPSDSQQKAVMVLKQYAFDSALQRMTVLTVTPNSHSVVAYTKGSPETIITMCEKESVPPDIHEYLERYTERGYRVLAVASKHIESVREWDQVKNLSRGEVECNLNFLGIIVFENIIKENSHDTINSLAQANIRSVMATGDNLQTATYVAWKLNIIRPLKNVHEMSFIEDVITYKKLNYAKASIRSKDITIKVNESTPFLVQPDKLENCLVLSGATYEVVRTKFQDLLPKILLSGAVFARMSPNQKSLLVEDLKEIGYGVCMCGDGANDCGALKAAQAGIALSDTEASIAAPFTSKVFDISCVPQLIKEGRASLTTAFDTFKYMALYAFIQFAGALILYAIKSNYSAFQFLYADLFLNLPLVLTMTLSYSSTEIVKKRPAGRLVHPLFIGSIVSQVLVLTGTQLVGFFLVRSMDWYKPSSAFANDGDMNYLAYENTVVIVISFFQYISLSLASISGKPYRAPVYTNYRYLIVFFLLLLLTAYITIYPAAFVLKTINFVHIPSMWFRVIIVSIAVLHSMISFAIEELFKTRAAKRISDWLRRKKEPRNRYKRVLTEMLKDKDWPPTTHCEKND